MMLNRGDTEKMEPSDPSASEISRSTKYVFDTVAAPTDSGSRPSVIPKKQPFHINTFLRAGRFNNGVVSWRRLSVRSDPHHGGATDQDVGRDLGQPLFKRTRDGAEPTDICKQTVPTAESIEQQVQHTSLTAAIETIEPEGAVRIHTAAWLIEHVLSPRVPIQILEAAAVFCWRCR